MEHTTTKVAAPIAQAIVLVIIQPSPGNAPFSTNTRAIASPIPRAAPVTIATLPSSRFMRQD